MTHCVFKYVCSCDTSNKLGIREQTDSFSIPEKIPFEIWFKVKRKTKRFQGNKTVILFL